MNATRIHSSDDVIPNPLESQLDELRRLRHDADEKYGYFALKNLRIKEFPELRMATFVDLWMLRSGIYNEKQFNELRELQRQSDEIQQNQTTDFMSFMKIRSQLNGYARTIWYYVPQDP